MSAALGASSGRSLTHADVVPFSSVFASRVGAPLPSGCRPWLGGFRVRGGYGCIKIGRRVEQAHRVAFALGGQDIPPGVVVRHTCDNKSCVAPAHLIGGTQLDNRRDAVERGLASGAKNNKNFATLTRDSVRALRADRAAGCTLRALADRYGVSEGAVSMAVNRITWSDVR